MQYVNEMLTQDILKVEQVVRRWVDTLVVGLNLCPFAKKELLDNRVRFAVTDASTEEKLLADLNHELTLLQSDPSIETTLLIHPNCLENFDEFNQFLDHVDALITYLDLEGVVQVATFHPDYRFAGTGEEDVENYTNRCPFPVLHLLREQSLERAIESHPDPENIPDRNIARLNQLGYEKIQHLLASCFNSVIGDQ